jgi:hypothetical protein
MDKDRLLEEGNLEKKIINLLKISHGKAIRENKVENSQPQNIVLIEQKSSWSDDFQALIISEPDLKVSRKSKRLREIIFNVVKIMS